MGEPPYDKVEAGPSDPPAADREGAYYFCPECYEASEPLHDYDEAIRCPKCGTSFRLT